MHKQAVATSSKSSVNSRVFKLLGKLTFVLFVAQVWASIMHLVQPIPMSNMIVSFSRDILSSWPIIGGFIYFLFAQILLYVIYVLLTGSVGILAARLFRLSDKAIMFCAFIVWLLASVALFLANQLFFHWSLFAVLPNTPLAISVIKISLTTLTVILSLFALFAIARLVEMIIKKMIKPIVVGIIGLFVIATPVIIAAKNHIQNHNNDVVTQQKPNIIIIGIDSLRPDFTSMEHPYMTGAPNVMPNVDKYLQQAAVFEHAYTPLARTFPAWMSILTGEESKINGVRVEVPLMSTVKSDHTLAKDLRAAGYETVFSTDDLNFNHVTTNLGFDKVIAPETGFDNFILGAFNDFPLSNLVMNSTIGRILFPYNYSSRAADITYYPNTFLSYVNDELYNVPQRPLFFAIHLTLPHWPFIFANSTIPTSDDSTIRAQQFYMYGAMAADQQFQQLLGILQQHHLLNNTLVFLISDHGQGLGYPNERVTGVKGYIPGSDKLSNADFNFFTEPSFGHGTDILNLTQYHVVFAVRGFGLATKIYPGKINQVGSLLDIKPTILSFLNLPLDNSRGISLLPWVTQPNNTSIVQRDLIAETGFTLPGILVANPSIQKTLEEGLSYFKIDPKSGDVYIRPEIQNLLIIGKQRAIFNYPWQVSCYPVNNKTWLVTVANMNTLQWTTDINSPLAQQANAKELLAKLRAFYGSEFHC